MKEAISLTEPGGSHKDIKIYLYRVVTLEKIKIGFQDQLSLNAGQKYCGRGAFCNTFDLH